MKKIILSALVCTTLAFASQEKGANDLVTHTEFGYSNTGGNTDITTFNLDLNAKKAWDAHQFDFKFDAQYADDNDVESKNKYLTELTYDHKFTEDFAFNYLVGYKEDKFSGFEYQAYTGPGASYKVLKLAEHKLDIGGNILYAEDKIEAIEYDATGAVINYPNPNNLVTVSTTPGFTNDYTSLRAKAKYEWKVLENLTFSQEATYRSKLSEMSNFFVFSKTAVKSKINSSLSFGINYKIDYVNQPVTGKVKTDTALTTSLIIDY